MSRDTDAMQFVLDLLTDGIFTSTTRQIGFTPHDKITEDLLPFVQIYAPVASSSEQERVIEPTLTFTLEIFDKAGSVERAAVGLALEELADNLRLDKSWGGTVQNGFVSDRTLANRVDLERTIGSLVMTVQLGFGTAPPSNITSHIDLSDSTKFIVTNAQVGNSQFIKNALGVRKNTPGGNIIVEASAASGQSGFPIDLSAFHRVRLLSYISPAYADPDATGTSVGPADFSLQLLDAANVNGFAYTPFPFVMGLGWVHFPFDLDNPTTTFGGGINLNNIGSVRFVWNMFFSATFTSQEFGLIPLSFFTVSRDRGVNAGRGYNPGF